MSRALDKDVKALLKATDPTAAYREICQALETAGLLDIEILGRSHPLPPGTSVLQDGRAVGVSKLALVQAFIVARRILNRHRENNESASNTDLLRATAVMLLMDPEHLTAANTRKRLIQKQADSGGRLADAVREERRLIDSLLTSRLHRHTKSPTLWNHRRWLLQLSRCLNLDIDGPGDIVNVVMVAGERHPKNYYAWCHARWLMAVLSDPAYQHAHDVGKERETVLSATIDWCYKHRDDTSGWSFLYFILFHSGPSSPKARSSTITNAMELAVSLRWGNESVWVFLRTAVSSGFLGQKEHVQFVTSIRMLRDTPSGDSAAWKVLERAHRWCETYRTATAAETAESTREL